MIREAEERNIEFIQSLFAATGSGDWDKAQTMVTEDFSANEALSLPFPGVFHGIAGLRELYGIVMSSLGVMAIDIVQMTAGGDYVVVIAEFKLESSTVRISLTEVFRFRDGKVCEIKAYYYDPAPLWEVFNERRKSSAAS